MNRDAKTCAQWIREYPGDVPVSVALAVSNILDRKRRSAKVLKLPGKTKAERKSEKVKVRREVREACSARARGRCECCGAGWMPSALELDHFWGRAREESVESCWMLCRCCHHAKTENKPSRLHWLSEFQAHVSVQGYEDQANRCIRAIALERAQHPERTTP